MKAERYSSVSAGVVFFLVALVMVPALHAQSVLNFPRLSFEQDTPIGLAIVNPTADKAAVTFTAYGADGLPLNADGFQNPIVIEIPAGQQFVSTAADLFGRAVPDATIAWLQAVSPASGLTGFFLLLNTSGTFMDGADLPAASQKVIFNLVRADTGTTTELNIINPSGEEANLQLQLISTGSVPIIKTANLSPHGLLRTDVATFFQVSDVPSAAFVVVDSNAAIAGFELVRNPDIDGIGLNARPSSERLDTLYFPQFSVLGQKKSQINLVNYSAEPVILTLSAFKPDGTLYDAANLKTNPVVRTLAGGVGLFEDIESLFGFTGTQTLEGWITVKSTSSAINGCIVHSTSATAAAAVTSNATGKTRALFSHIVTSSGFTTGLTILNPSTLAANLRIVALTAKGEVLGSFDSVLQPGQRLAKSLGAADFIPEAANQLGGFIWVRSDVPLFLYCLIASENTYADIPAQDAIDTYLPDSGLAAIKVKPTIAIVPPGSSQRFQIEGTGTGIVWKVNGSAVGSATTGTISTAGVFSAPKTVPARQTVTVTADSGKQSGGASADILDKKVFVGNLSVIESVTYMDSLRKIYTAELTALSGSPQAPSMQKATGPTVTSQIFEVSPLLPKVGIAIFNNDVISKIIVFHAIDEKDYLLLAGQTSGIIYRLNPETKDVKTVVTDLVEPTAMVIDPVTGDLLVAEKEKITTVPKSILEADLSAPNSEAGSELNAQSQLAAQLPFNITGASGISVDRCTGKVYYTIAVDGILAEYNPVTDSTRTLVSNLKNPGPILGMYRTGVTCPDAFHMLVAERGADRVLLVSPSLGTVAEWHTAPGITDLAFLPPGNPFATTGGVLLADYTLSLDGFIFLVPLIDIYDPTPPNAPDGGFVNAKSDLNVSQVSSPFPLVTSHTLTYTITVGNAGPSKATGTTLVDTLPADVQLISVTTSQGICSVMYGKVVCSIGTLIKGRSAQVRIDMLSESSTSQTVQNTATVTSAEVDPNPRNNTSTVESNIIALSVMALDIEGLPFTPVAGQSYQITVTARDFLGNAVPFYAGTVHVSSTDDRATLPADHTFSPNEKGVYSFETPVVFRTAGKQTISIADLGADHKLKTETVVTVVPGAAAALVFSGIAGPITAGAAQTLTISAKDAFGNTDTQYAGAVHFQSTDPASTLPADYAFKQENAGSLAIQVVLRTAGTQTITVTGSAAEFSLGGLSEIMLGNGSISGTISVTVNPGAPSRLDLAFPSNTSVAGASLDLRVTVQDSFGNVAKSYTGRIGFTSTDTKAALPGEYVFAAADNGSHLFAGGVTMKTSGTQSVTATDSASAGIRGSAQVSVDPGPVFELQMSGIPNPSLAGGSANVNLVAKDSFGNVASGYRGTIRFTSTDSNAVLPASYTFIAADAGSRSFAGGVSLRTSGTQSVTATDTAQATLTCTQIVTVNPGSAANLILSGLPGSVAAGSPQGVSVQLKDAYGNVASGYAGTVHFTSNDSNATLPADYAFASGDAGTHTFTGGVVLRTAGNRTVTCSDSSNASVTGSQSVTVNAAEASTLILTGLPDQTAAGTAQSVRIQLRDPYGNTAIGYTGTVHFVATDPRASLPADYTFAAADAGVHNFADAVTLRTVGSQIVTATDTKMAGLSARETIGVTPAAAAVLEISGLSGTSSVGVPVSFTVQLKDSFGNVATNYTGTVRFSSTDTSATLPANYTFATADAGSHIFSSGLIFRTVGAQTLTVIDIARPALTASQAVTVNAGAAQAMAITGLASPIDAGTPQSPTVEVRDARGNLALGYTGTIRFSSTDPNATLPADYTFTAADGGTHTFTGQLILRTAGSRVISVNDLGQMGLAAGSAVSVDPGPTTALVLSGLSGNVAAGSLMSFTVQAFDSFGNTDTRYRGTVRFTSTDTAALLSPPYAFSAADAGKHTFAEGVTFRTAGLQTLSVTDVAQPGLTSSQPSTVSPPVGTNIVLSGIAGSVTAGTALSPTVQIRDNAGAPITNYTGTVRFTSTDPNAVLPPDYTFTLADAGAHTFPGQVLLRSAGTHSLSVTDVAQPLVFASQIVVVSPGAAVSLQVSGLPNPAPAGAPLNMTITPRDAYGNAAAGYTGSVRFSSTDSGAALPRTYTFTIQDAGAHTFASGVVLRTLGTQSVTATDAVQPSLSGSQSVTVSAGAAAAMRIFGLPGATVAGTPLSASVTLLDAVGNIANNYRGAVHFTSVDSNAVLPADYTFTAADAGTHVFSGAIILKTAGNSNVTITDPAQQTLTASQSIAIAPAAAAALQVSGLANPLVAGTPSDMIVRAMDPFGNIATGYLGTVGFAASLATGGELGLSLPSSYTFTTGDAGQHVFKSGVAIYYYSSVPGSGTLTLTATDTSNTSIAGSQVVAVVGGSPYSLQVSGIGDPLTAGIASPLTVTVRDIYGNPSTGYRGTVHFTSTDSNATLPADYTFAAADSGEHTFPGGVTLRFAGTQTVYASDTSQQALFGSQTVTVTPGAVSGFFLSGIPNPAVRNTT